MTKPMDVEVRIGVTPFLGKVVVHFTRRHGATDYLLRGFLRKLESAAHTYSLMERINKNYRLADCRHPKKMVKRRKGGTFCLKCGARMEVARLRQRAEPIKEVKLRLVATPPVRRARA